MEFHQLSSCSNAAELDECSSPVGTEDPESSVHVVRVPVTSLTHAASLPVWREGITGLRGRSASGRNRKSHLLYGNNATNVLCLSNPVRLPFSSFGLFLFFVKW